MADGQSAQPLGLRERNKRSKRERIIKAARAVFAEKGFDATTLREVAVAADIGTGTLFLYVKTKEDLLVLVSKHELEPVLFGAFRKVPKTTLLKQLLFVFKPLVDHHQQNLNLARPFLRDLAFVNEPVASVIAEFFQGWFVELGKLVDAAKARGEIREEIDTATLVSCSTQLFLGQLRRWAAGQINRKELDVIVRDSLAMLLNGLAPATAAPPPKAAKKAGSAWR